VVPETRDMVSQLLSPSQPKNIGDIVVLAILGIHILSLFLLPQSFRIPTFAVVFLSWRLAYNAGIGYLLYLQSNHTRLVAWAKKSKIFVNPAKGENPHPKLYKFIKRELETKIPKDYKFDDVPIEYNTWLVFRRIVDLILMCDFVSYCLFAIACARQPVGESVFMTISRWVCGLVLVGFNLWVKLDAHRVVKDFAWYWGDFFYLIDKELIFDGVFEMAPHPMYSIGYAGYYGISAMAASYNVLFISIVAHAMQFAFLRWVEVPHIEKTYNKPAPRKQSSNEEIATKEEQATSINGGPSLASTYRPSPTHNLLGISNIDLLRVTDVSSMIILFYMFFTWFWTPSTQGWQIFFVSNAAVLRIWYSSGLGFFLRWQSTRKGWIRHFLKYGESTEEAWRQWKGMYYLSETMAYGAFITAVLKVYQFPDDWNSELVLLKHIIGLGLIALQIWTAKSIHDSLGEFGWFYGDFFFNQSVKLNYSGIYRFLNNPEQFIGMAGLWGAALITGAPSIFFLAALSHGLAIIFHYAVERPHMLKLYGREIRRDSGFMKSIKRILPIFMQQWDLDQVLDNFADSIEEFIESTRPKINAHVKTLMRDPANFFNNLPIITSLDSDMAQFDPKDYKLEILGQSNSGSLVFPYGTPIKLRWTAPLHHSKRDWVGLYQVAQNPSRIATSVSSKGRWVPTNLNQYNSTTIDAGCLKTDLHDDNDSQHVCGEMQFSGEKLWWTSGTYEFRYHHNGAHNVLAVSQPFEIRIDRFDEEDVEIDENGLFLEAAEKALLPVVQNCFDRDPDLAPATVTEMFGSLIDRNGKFSRRIVYAVQQMFGIELDPDVVKMDGTVRNMAWRICTAKKVLVSLVWFYSFFLVIIPLFYPLFSYSRLLLIISFTIFISRSFLLTISSTRHPTRCQLRQAEQHQTE
jgi:phosphatidylethanolamine N-methyltransferase